MSLSTTICFSVILVGIMIAIIAVFRYKFGKEEQMGRDLKTLIARDDWQGVSRILRDQLRLWSILLLLMTFFLFCDFFLNKKWVVAVIGWLFVAYRTVKLLKLWLIARKNERLLADKDKFKDEEKPF